LWGNSGILREICGFFAVFLVYFGSILAVFARFPGIWLVFGVGIIRFFGVF